MSSQAAGLATGIPGKKHACTGGRHAGGHGWLRLGHGGGPTSCKTPQAGIRYGIHFGFQPGEEGRPRVETNVDSTPDPTPRPVAGSSESLPVSWGGDGNVSAIWLVAFCTPIRLVLWYRIGT